MKRSQHKVPLTWCLQSFIPWPSSADGVAKLSWKWFSCYDMAGDKFIGPCGKYLFVTLLFPWSKRSLACNRFFSSVWQFCRSFLQHARCWSALIGRAREALPTLELMEELLYLLSHRYVMFATRLRSSGTPLQSMHTIAAVLQEQQTTNLSELSSDFSRVSDSD